MKTGLRASFKLDVDEDKIRDIIKKGGVKGVWAALDHVATKSKQIVPLDKGPLMNSCYVDVSNDGLSGTISYDTPYAIIQHENAEFHHQRGRMYKYLERFCDDKETHEEMLKIMQEAYQTEANKH